jgi:hypothetical protein
LQGQFLIDAPIIRTEWQNLYLRREIMVLRMGIKEAVRTGGMIG